MDSRPAEPADRSSIVAIARESFRSSYALSPGQVETIVGHEFTDGSADGLDRLECGECGNLHLADECDDSYL